MSPSFFAAFAAPLWGDAANPGAHWHDSHCSGGQPVVPKEWVDRHPPPFRAMAACWTVITAAPSQRLMVGNTTFKLALRFTGMPAFGHTGGQRPLPQRLVQVVSGDLSYAAHLEDGSKAPPNGELFISYPKASRPLSGGRALPLPYANSWQARAWSLIHRRPRQEG